MDNTERTMNRKTEPVLERQKSARRPLVINRGSIGTTLSSPVVVGGGRNRLVELGKDANPFAVGRWIPEHTSPPPHTPSPFHWPKLVIVGKSRRRGHLLVSDLLSSATLLESHSRVFSPGAGTRVRGYSRVLAVEWFFLFFLSKIKRRQCVPVVSCVV